MSTVRIRCSLADPPLRCAWATSDGVHTQSGEGLLRDVPRGTGRVQMVIPGSQVLLLRTRLPDGVRRQSDAVLAYAVEEQIACDPETVRVSWIGTAGGQDVLAVMDRIALDRWLEALYAIGYTDCEVYGETLLLPLREGAWSLAWDGREGLLRSGQVEGMTTDRGSRDSPPLSLRIAIAEATGRQERPEAIEIHETSRDAAPDVQVWQRELGIPVRLGRPWNWYDLPASQGIALLRHRRHWRGLQTLFPALKPALWIAAIALILHAFALVVDWSMLARERQTLRKNMEQRFRATFPDTVAVVDPALQMRRKLAEARHTAGVADTGDFLPMIDRVAAAISTLPAGSLRALAYDNGRAALEFSGLDDAAVHQLVERLAQSGLMADAPAEWRRHKNGNVTITVRAA